MIFVSPTYRPRLCVIAIADTLRRNSAVIRVPYSLLTPVELAQSPVSGLQTLASAFVGPDGVRQSSSGILFPFSDGFAHLRCDEKPHNRQGDPCKYLTPVGCKFSLKVFSDGEPVIATEGWKDAFRIHLETSQTTVALPIWKRAQLKEARTLSRTEIQIKQGQPKERTQTPSEAGESASAIGVERD